MNMQSSVVPAYDDEVGDDLSFYTDLLSLIERLHRQLLDVIKRDLERLEVRDLNAVQAMILFNIGPKTLTAGELTSRGYYHGSNVSHNLRKMTDLGYVACNRCRADKRAVRVQLTEKGMGIHSAVESLLQRHAKDLHDTGSLPAQSIRRVSRRLSAVELYWAEQIRSAL